MGHGRRRGSRGRFLRVERTRRRERAKEREDDASAVMLTKERGVYIRYLIRNLRLP